MDRVAEVVHECVAEGGEQEKLHEEGWAHVAR